MHILIVVSWYKTHQQPVLGTFFEEQARMLMRRGIKVGILYPHFDMRFSSRWRSRKPDEHNFIDNGLPTYYSFSQAIVPRSRKINFWFGSYKAEKVFKKYVRAHGMPDLLHAHSVFHGGIAAAYISKKYRIPFLLTEHYSGLIIDGIQHIPAARKELTSVFRHSKSNIVVSESFRESLIELYDLNTVGMSVVHNVVNPMFFSVKSRPVLSPFVFTINAFLTENKNHQLLFRSFVLTNRRHPCRLNIIGDGPLRSQLERLADALGITQQLRFYGNIGRSEVKAILDESHALVSTSLFETFGVGIAEALASGLPVVVTNSGGPRDFVDAENGLLVNDFNEQSFSSAMISVIETYGVYDPIKISEKCTLQMSESVIAGQLDAIYSECIYHTDENSISGL